MIEFDSKDEKEVNGEIEILIKSYIDNGKYSYHQINIFINIFISHYCKLGTKLIIRSNGKDISEEVINQFASCTQYFINGIFTKILLDYETWRLCTDFTGGHSFERVDSW